MSHYAPRTPAQLVVYDVLRAELAQLEGRDERVAVLARSAEPPEGFDGVWLAAPQDAQDYARALYANLRALDDANADVILVESVPQDPAWAAIQDRLERATTGVDDDSD